MKRTLILLAFAILTQGCVQQLAIRSMSGIMDNGFQAFNEESDLQLAHESLGSNLKLLEALLKGDPDNEQLLSYACQGYTAYALAFAEDDSVERARVFYVRARDFGLRILTQDSKFNAALGQDDEAFRQAVNGLKKDMIPAAFWTALSWGSYINITRDQVSALADLPKAIALMEFVEKNDSAFYFGGADMFLGAIQGSTPAALGGKPERSKAHFEKCLAINGGKFLLAYVYYAKTYCVQVQDQELFNTLLQKVENASADILPEARLANAVAKRKARLLKARENDLF